jgi:hypothetical protein
MKDAASQRFSTQLMAIIKEHKDIVINFMRFAHANTHSVRKGSGTYSQSGTTAPPPATATAGRGEWSLGRVFDIYIFLSEPGDTYLGRILAGLDPLEETFASLPPRRVVMYNPALSQGCPHVCFLVALDVIICSPALRREGSRHI